MSNSLSTDIASRPPTALTETAREFVGASLRPNTRRAYAAQLRAWIAYCEAGGAPPFPADPMDVANWLASRAEGGQSISTLRTAVAAVKAGHDAKGLAFDSAAVAITRALRGIANLRPALPRQAEPLRSQDVSAIVSMLSGSVRDRRDAALVALGYSAGLRRSELIGLDYVELGTGTGRLRLTARAIEVEFAITKTSTGTSEIVTIPRAENAGLVRALEAWVEIAGIASGEPLFRSVRKGGAIGGRLSAAAVAQIVKDRVEGMGGEAECFSGHSLRVGFAVSAAEAGADLRSIATVTRHRSLTMPARYAAKADALRTSPHRLPGVGIGQG